MSDVILYSASKWTWDGRTVYMVLAPYEMSRDNPGIVGKEITLDGERCRVTGVERNLPLFPIRKGELIGIMVEPL